MDGTVWWWDTAHQGVHVAIEQDAVQGLCHRVTAVDGGFDGGERNKVLFNPIKQCKMSNI
jgi:hypothetical protein